MCLTLELREEMGRVQLLAVPLWISEGWSHTAWTQGSSITGMVWQRYLQVSGERSWVIRIWGFSWWGRWWTHL